MTRWKLAVAPALVCACVPVTGSGIAQDPAPAGPLKTLTLYRFDCGQLYIANPKGYEGSQSAIVPPFRTLKSQLADVSYSPHASRAALEEFLRARRADLWIEHDSVHDRLLKKAPAYYE